MSKDDIMGGGFKLANFGITKKSLKKIIFVILGSGPVGVGFFFALAYTMPFEFIRTYFPNTDDGIWMLHDILIGGILGALLVSCRFIYKRDWIPVVYALIAGPIIAFFFVASMFSIACSMGNCL